MLNGFSELGELVRDGFTDWEQHGDVRAVCHDGLVLFNYSHAAHYNNRWNWFERVSRGLILDAKTGKVVARPFEKFFNWFERGRKTDAHLLEVTEKQDGSLGILYRHKGQYKMSTRGSFTGEQAIWATEFFNAHHNRLDLKQSLTPLFEIIYPDNRIVVDYGDKEDLVLLAVRDIDTGKYLPYYPDLYQIAASHDFSLPQVFQFNSVQDILELAGQIGANQEGWVMLFSDGQRFKIKGDKYTEVHRLVTNASFKRVLKAIADGTFNDVLAGIPDEFLGQMRAWEREIETKVKLVTQQVQAAFKVAPKNGRKEFALWAGEHHPDLAAYLFLMLNGKDIRPAILQREFD